MASPNPGCWPRKTMMSPTISGTTRTALASESWQRSHATSAPTKSNVQALKPFANRDAWSGISPPRALLMLDVRLDRRACGVCILQASLRILSKVVLPDLRATATRQRSASLLPSRVSPSVRHPTIPQSTSHGHPTRSTGLSIIQSDCVPGLPPSTSGPRTAPGSHECHVRNTVRLANSGIESAHTARHWNRLLRSNAVTRPPPHTLTSYLTLTLTPTLRQRVSV